MIRHVLNNTTYLTVLLLCLLSFQTVIAGITDTTLSKPALENNLENNLKQNYDFGKEDVPWLLARGSEICKKASRNNNPELMAKGYLMQGLGHFHSFNYHIAVDFFLKALKLTEKIEGNLYENSSEYFSVILNKKAVLEANIGYVYDEIRDYQMAIFYFEKAIETFRNLENIPNLTFTLNGYALSLNALKLHDKALIFLKQLLQLKMEAADSLGISGAYNNIGLVYIEKADYEKAIENFEYSIEINKKVGDKKREAASLFNLGVIEGRKENYDGKLKYYLETMDLLLEIEDTRGLIRIQVELAQYYFEINDYNTSLSYLSEALTSAVVNDEKDFITSINHYMSEIYRAQGNYKLALEYQNRHNRNKDSLFQNNIGKIAELRMKYEEEQKATIQKELEIQKLTIQKEKNFRNYLLILVLLLTSVVFLVYSRFRLKKKNNKILSDQKNQLELSNLTKNKFFSIIAHDLKNPMGACFSLSDMLYNNFQNFNENERFEIITQLKKSSSLTFQLLENLLQWSMAQSGRIVFMPANIKLNQIIDNNISLFQEVAKKKNIKLFSDLNKEYFVFADENMISSVIRNLLSNAIKFSDGGKTVKVSCRETTTEIITSVSDEGVGMSAEDQEKLFRIEVNTTEIGTSKEKGTGLGLILCKEFIEKNGGIIRIESELDKGSNFIFTLRKAKDEQDKNCNS